MGRAPLPDHPLRDVAGMVRSFDYAAHYPLLTGREDSPSSVSASRSGPTTTWRRSWRVRVDVGRDPRDEAALLDAFILDKAIYECLYEAQNRPGWLELPLAAVARLLDTE